MTQGPISPLRLLAMLAVSAVLGACSSAGRCRRGDEGCKATSSGVCASGLVRNEAGFCVDANGGSGGSGGGSGGSGGSGGGGSGGSGGGPPDIACAAEDLPTACELFCQAFCANQELLCITSACTAGYCDRTGEAVATCLDECATGGAACAVRACEAQLAMTCEEFAWRMNPSDTTEPYTSFCLMDDPDCVHFGPTECSDTCGSSGSDGVGGQLVDDGSCDDGSDGRTALCTRGTDCTDCGASTCTELGSACSGHEECCGFEAPGAFCVMLGTPDAPEPTCLGSCTESRTCQEGFSCTPTEGDVDWVCAPD